MISDFFYGLMVIYYTYFHHSIVYASTNEHLQLSEINFLYSYLLTFPVDDAGINSNHYDIFLFYESRRLITIKLYIVLDSYLSP